MQSCTFRCNLVINSSTDVRLLTILSGRGAQHGAPLCIPPVICTRNQHPRIDPDKQILRIKLGQLQVLSTSIVATGVGKRDGAGLDRSDSFKQLPAP